MSTYTHKVVEKYALVRLYRGTYEKYSIDTKQTSVDNPALIVVAIQGSTCLLRDNTTRVYRVAIVDISFKSIIPIGNQRYKAIAHMELNKAVRFQHTRDRDYQLVFTPTPEHIPTVQPKTEPIPTPAPEPAPEPISITDAKLDRIIQLLEEVTKWLKG